jgi:catechol 2,3-dioxygenase-like lactoylglutathione lyase family enzyme
MVRHVATASTWYDEKFGLRKLAEQARPDGVALQFDEAADPVILIPRDPAIFRRAPVFFTRKVGKVRSRLIANGVSVSPVQQDRQGTKFFEVLDGEGNPIEVSEQP